MLQLGGELDLALEPLGADRGGQLRVQDLDGDLAARAARRGEEDRGHAATPQLPLDRVPVGEAGGQLVLDVTHVRPLAIGR